VTGHGEPPRVVDARGLSCPLPATRTLAALAGAPAALAVLVSTGAARSSVVDLLREEGFRVEVEDVGEAYRVLATRA
jgi:TusA-related sulfurtransferase